MVESEYHLDAETLTEVFGTTDRGFNYGLLRQLRRASPDDHDEIEFMLAVIRDLKPRNRLDAMLAAQMAAVHMATMTLAGRLAQVDTTLEQDSAGTALNKLVRTFTMQLEALTRYRTGEQSVTVQNVSVSQGGQAIVGNVTQTTRDTALEKPAEQTPALTDARQPTMPIIEPKRARVPLRRGRTNDGRPSA